CEYEKKNWEVLHLSDNDYLSIQKKLGKEIKIARLKKEVTILELSQISGIGDSYLSRLENGRLTSPSLKTYLKVCYALNLNPASFFATASESPPFNADDYNYID
ncbi:helix-turn-helix domain-containing protein, partial [Enterococcus avium]|uniref:helix-turn-helix domain-containing protein n=1 Tax=Enterococcus avium TaxID=33945 RepID=UPI002891B41B